MTVSDVLAPRAITVVKVYFSYIYPIYVANLIKDYDTS